MTDNKPGNLKTYITYSERFASIILLFLLLIACNKKPDQIGLNLQPASVELSVIFDSEAGLLSHSLREDSVRTDGNAIKTAMLGSMLDPVFGKTTAEIFSQFRLSENGHSFGTGAILDSLILSLAYTGLYGDSLSSQTIRVYELNESMNADTTYFSNQSLEHLDDELALVTFVPAPGDSVIVDGEKAAPQLRIRLSDVFAQTLLDPTNASAYDDNESFLEFMKGLHISAEPVQADGSIMLFDMFASYSKMTIFYHSADLEDTLSFDFLSNENCARFTSFNHDDYQHASSEFQAQVLNGDTALGADHFYLQGMGGVKAQIRLPDIQEFFKDGPVAINEAKLIFHIYDDGVELAAPPELALAIIDEEGNFLPLPDATEGSSYYGGSLNDAKDQYYFRISRHVQQVLTGVSPNYPLALLISGASFRANRLILHGPDSIINSELRMKLNIIYTKVN